jgi:hypothetical protein
MSVSAIPAAPQRVRTTADAVREDAYLMEEITFEEYSQAHDGRALTPSNFGDLSHMLKRSREIEASLGAVDPYATHEKP